MRSIVYILLSVFIASILFTSIKGFTSEKRQVISLQCVEKQISPDLLEQSALIIKHRFETFGLNPVNVIVKEDKCKLLVDFTGNVKLETLRPLATLKGHIGFFEVYNNVDTISLIKGDIKTIEGLNVSLKENDLVPESEAILGYCKGSDRLNIDSQLQNVLSHYPNKNIQFFWGSSANEKGFYNLFLLKKHAALEKSDILKSSVINNGAEILIGFNESGKQLWQSLTKNNIGNSIALVLDNRVYFAPIVKTEISNGSCLISGDFSWNELKYLNSIISSKELPLKFEVVD